MALPRPVRPSAFLSDMRAFLGGDQRHKLLVAVLAICMPAIIVYGFIRDGRTNILPGRRITYMADWPATRTDAEIEVQNRKDQKLKDRRDAEKRAAYRRLADRMGIDY